LLTNIGFCKYICPNSTGTASNKTSEALDALQEHGGILRTGQAHDLGIYQRTLYALRDNGLLERLSKGPYRLADLPPLSDPDLAIVTRKIPGGVVCLISAPNFHDIMTQMPDVVSVAVRRGKDSPPLKYPPTKNLPVWRSSRSNYAPQ